MLTQGDLSREMKPLKKRDNQMKILELKKKEMDKLKRLELVEESANLETSI